jgi:hypothetical protein
MKRSPRPKLKEKDTQRAILDCLAAKRIFHYRNNSGGFKDSQNHFYRFGALGSPDIIAVIGGKYIGIEVKGSDGKQSEYQQRFELELVRAGGMYILGGWPKYLRAGVAGLRGWPMFREKRGAFVLRSNRAMKSILISGMALPEYNEGMLHTQSFG